ncbi:MAG: hypothetical protein HYZ35_04695 [Chloroflexi bacterium]|nr:hypothetical protein [Chloroflexota bacterium]
MPTFAELLSQFSFLASGPASVGVLLTAALIVIFADWRISVLALAAQSILAGLLYSQILPPQVAGVKMMVGLLICVQLFITARTAYAAPPAVEGEPVGKSVARKDARKNARKTLGVSVGAPFRVVATLMVAVVSWQVSTSPALQLSEVTAPVGLAVYGLIALGLLGLGLTEEPLRVGMCLITVLTGFELYYAAVEPALAVMALLAVMDFAVSLGACYLAVVRSLPQRSAAG